MKTCATCRFMAAPRSAAIYWFDSDSDQDVESEHASCARIIHGNVDSCASRKAAKELAVVTDGSGYAARLCVLPTFGCVLHEEKEE